MVDKLVVARVVESEVEVDAEAATGEHDSLLGCTERFVCCDLTANEVVVEARTATEVC